MEKRYLALFLRWSAAVLEYASVPPPKGGSSGADTPFTFSDTDAEGVVEDVAVC
jgi:hypothetical protein